MKNQVLMDKTYSYGYGCEIRDWGWSAAVPSSWGYVTGQARRVQTADVTYTFLEMDGDVFLSSMAYSNGYIQDTLLSREHDFGPGNWKVSWWSNDQVFQNFAPAAMPYIDSGYFSTQIRSKIFSRTLVGY